MRVVWEGLDSSHPQSSIMPNGRHVETCSRIAGQFGLGVQPLTTKQTEKATIDLAPQTRNRPTPLDHMAMPMCGVCKASFDFEVSWWCTRNRQLHRIETKAEQ